jgi:hypothetical protein
MVPSSIDYLLASICTNTNDARMGPSRILLSLPLKAAGLYLVYLIHTQEDVDDPTATVGWTSRDDVERFRNDLVGWEPR